MRAFIITCFFLFSLDSFAQYYYKDILGTHQTTDLVRHYKANKVSHVVLTSYNSDNSKNEDFYVEQRFASNILTTVTRSGITNESVLTSYLDEQGNVIRTVDSSESAISNTIYNYDREGRLINITSNSTDSLKSSNESEKHIWTYNNGAPSGMVRIKDGTDTTYIDFKADDKKNIVEEREIHAGSKSEPLYYYYDGENRLTDIVRYNKRAKRLLPEYMFEYSPAGQVLQLITVPANSSDYLIWRYLYDARGLKIKEAIYNKEKKLTGKIEYQYSYYP